MNEETCWKYKHKDKGERREWNASFHGLLALLSQPLNLYLSWNNPIHNLQIIPSILEILKPLDQKNKKNEVR